MPGSMPESASGSVSGSAPESAPGETSVFDLSDKSLHQCIGCWTCWLKTPGRCAFKDLNEFYEGYLSADRVTFYVLVSQGFVTSNMKALIDRMIPFVLPSISWATGESLHEPRYTRYPEVDVFYQGDFLPDEEEAFIAYWKRTLLMMFAPRVFVQRFQKEDVP